MKLHPALLFTSLALAVASPHPLSGEAGSLQGLKPRSPLRSDLEVAEELVEWKMYGIASAKYENILFKRAVGGGEGVEEIALKLAKLYLLLNEPLKAKELLENEPLFTPSDKKPHPSQMDEERALLLSIASIELGDPKRVQSLLQPATEKSKLLLSMALSAEGRYSEAKELLKPLWQEPEIAPLTKVHLLKVTLLSRSYREALKMAQAAAESLPKNHPLYPELLFLKAIAEYRLEEYSASMNAIKEAVELPGSSREKWYSKALVGLSQATNLELPAAPSEERKRLLETIATLLTEELERSGHSSVALAAVKMLIQIEESSNGEKHLETARSILNDPNLFCGPSEAQNIAMNTPGKSFCASSVRQESLCGVLEPFAVEKQTLLLRAQTAATYLEREGHLKELTSGGSGGDRLIAYGFFLRGSNEREEAYSEKMALPPAKKRAHLQKAMEYYNKSYRMLLPIDPLSAVEALKEWGQIAHDLSDKGELETVYSLADNQPSSPESDYLKGVIAAHLYNLTAEERYIDRALSTLSNRLNGSTEIAYRAQERLNGAPHESEKIYSDKIRLLYGKLLYLKNSFRDAEEALAAIGKDSPLSAEALYFAGRSAERCEKPLSPPSHYYKAIAESYRLSPFAKEARFKIYTPQEYLRGDREARRHLEEFVAQEKESPYNIDAAFLLALDTKRDRKSDSGRWISKGSITKAIDLFQEVKNRYQYLREKGALPHQEKEHYLALALRASLEQALCNLQIAKESSGAKKEIFLQYAEELFQELISNPDMQLPANKDLYEEAVYGAGKAYLEGEKEQRAEEAFQMIIDRSRSSKVTRGYYLSRALYHLASLSIKQENYRLALSYLSDAEEAAKGRFLSTDQTIDLWLQMSHCHKMMGEYGEAMRLLTKAIDEDAISGLRLKAMFLRAEIYQLQGRSELSRKQLEAASKKGGEWGKKAKEKLNEEFQHQ